MANFSWPTSILPSNFSLSRYTKILRGISVFGKSGQNIDLVQDRWKCSLGISVKSSSDAARLEAFVNSLRGGANTVELYHFGRPAPLGSITGQCSVRYTVSKGSRSLTILTNPGATLLAGDMLGVGGYLYQVATDAVANSGGELTVNLVTRVKGSVLGFARASTATYTTQTGDVALAVSDVPRISYKQSAFSEMQHNFFKFSEQFGETYWSKGATQVISNAAAAPDGTFTADKLVELAGLQAHSLQGSLQVQPNTAITLSIHLKAAERGYAIFQVMNSDSVYGSTQVNLSNGSASRYSGTVTSNNFSATLVSSGWYRVSASIDSGSAGGSCKLFILVSDGTSSQVYTGIANYGIYIWGAQANVGSLKPYKCTSIRNMVRYSEELTNLLWDSPNSSVSVSSTTQPVTLPAGLQSLKVFKLVSDAGVTGYINSNLELSTVVGVTYTVSIYAKAAERDKLCILVYGIFFGGGANKAIVFNLSNGTTTVDTSAPESSSIASVGNGWYLCSISVKATAATTGSWYQYRNTENGDGSSGIFISSPQIADSSAAEVYTPTTGVTNFPDVYVEPTTFSSVGLLQEPYGENIQLGSDCLGFTVGANTTKVLSTTVPNPRGSGSTLVVSGNGNTSNCFAAPAAKVTLLENTNYVVSVYAMLVSGYTPTDGNILSVEYYNSSGVLTRRNLPYQANPATKQYRRYEVVVNSSIAGQFQVYVSQGTSSTSQIAFWGLQCTAGSVNTSLIDSTTYSKGVRFADSLGVTVVTEAPTAKFRLASEASTTYSQGGVILSTTLELVEQVP